MGVHVDDEYIIVRLQQAGFQQFLMGNADVVVKTKVLRSALAGVMVASGQVPAVFAGQGGLAGLQGAGNAPAYRDKAY